MSRAAKRKGSESKLKQTSMGAFLSKPKVADKKKKSKMFGSYLTRGSYYDTQEYRSNYPGKKDNLSVDDNFQFYTNSISSKPDGDYIDKIHENWWGDYGRLERHHGYIQWLFPIRESGMNWHSQELQLHEIEKLKKNEKAMERILKSYELMLDFYGMELVNKENGELKRGDDWRNRFRHLNRSYHNYLRITRILKCLGEFGYEGLKANFVRFILYEAIVKQTLTNVLDSCMKFWIGVIRSDEERSDLLEYYEKLTEEKADAGDDSDDDEEEEEEEKEEKVKKPVKIAGKGRGKGVPKKAKGASNSATPDVDTDKAKSIQQIEKAKKEHEMSDSDDEELNQDMDLLGDNYSDGSHEADQAEPTLEYSLDNKTNTDDDKDDDDNDDDDNDEKDKTTNGNSLNGSEHTSAEEGAGECKKSKDTLKNKQGGTDDVKDTHKDMDSQKLNSPDKIADNEEYVEENKGNQTQSADKMEVTENTQTQKSDETEEQKDKMDVE